MKQTQQIDIPPKRKGAIIKLMNKLNRDEAYADKQVRDINLEKRNVGDEIYSSDMTYLTITVANHQPSKGYDHERYWSKLYMMACDYLGYNEYKFFDDGEIVSV